MKIRVKTNRRKIMTSTKSKSKSKIDSVTLHEIRVEAGYKAHETLMARKLHAKRSAAAKKAWETIRSRQVG